MTRKTILILVICTLTVFVVTPLEAGDVFKSGHVLVKGMRENDKCVMNIKEDISWIDVGEYMGFIIGVHDATWSEYATPKNATIGQIIEVVSKYLKEHPERWSEPAYWLVRDALEEAFPKKESTTQ